MLERLLQLLAEAEGAVAVSELARRLEVSDRLVEPMIEELVRLGYLEATEPGCAGRACRRCGLAGSCASLPLPRLWRLTARGRAAALPPSTPPRPSSRSGR